VSLDSKSVLISSDVLMPEECLVTEHSGSDLEFDSVSKWVLWVVVSLSVVVPGLVQSIVASVPDDVSVVSVRVSMDIQASCSLISDVSSASSEPSDLLKTLVSVVSSNSSVAVVAPVVSIVLNGDDESSVTSSSDSSGSPVKYPPLSNVVWVVVLDSESVLVVTNVLVVSDSSSVSHERFDLEFDSISQWVSWEVNSSSIKEPSLTNLIVAIIPVGKSVVAVAISLGTETSSTWVSDVSVVSWVE